MTIVTPTERQKPVRNHCVMEGFGVVSWLTFSNGMGAFSIGLGQISSFSLSNCCKGIVDVVINLYSSVDVYKTEDYNYTCILHKLSQHQQ